MLTFDDAVKSQRTFVAPLLKDMGFGATFFVTHGWMSDRENFMTWEEIAEIHRMGFEIGNHTWTHAGVGTPRRAARLRGEMALVEYELRKVGVPRPVSFAYPGNFFGPEAIQILMERGYRFARRGMQPEVPYGALQPGPSFDPARNHRLVIPSTGDAYPNWTQEHFKRVIAEAKEGTAAVIQFHGIPDRAHPWVHTSPENFRSYMEILRNEGFRVIALRDLEPFVKPTDGPEDPNLTARYLRARNGAVVIEEADEVVSTRADLRYWLDNMLRHHRYTAAEAAQVSALTEAEVQKHAAQLEIPVTREPLPQRKQPVVVPYPGGRHPRIGFLEGAVDPMRGTKASVFLPWDPASYVVVDLPEAIFSNLGLIFLAHTHIPTVWNEQNLTLENVDWTREPAGRLSHRRVLPNGVAVGAVIQPVEDHIAMELCLENGSPQDQTRLRTQVCVMLKGAPAFSTQTNDNKLFRSPIAAVRSAKGDRWILTAWERCDRTWGNPAVPCLHSDPLLPDCPSGKKVIVRGQLWFFQGDEIDKEMERARAALAVAWGV